MGDRRAVAVAYQLISFFESDPPEPDPPEDRYDRGPWELQQWDGTAWQPVGSATKRRSRDRFLKRQPARASSRP
jgi:hypothetical protein